MIFLEGDLVLTLKELYIDLKTSRTFERRLPGERIIAEGSVGFVAFVDVLYQLAWTIINDEFVGLKPYNIQRVNVNAADDASISG